MEYVRNLFSTCSDTKRNDMNYNVIINNTLIIYSVKSVIFYIKKVGVFHANQTSMFFIHI